MGQFLSLYVFDLLLKSGCLRKQPPLLVFADWLCGREVIHWLVGHALSLETWKSCHIFAEHVSGLAQPGVRLSRFRMYTAALECLGFPRGLTQQLLGALGGLLYFSVHKLSISAVCRSVVPCDFHEQWLELFPLGEWVRWERDQSLEAVPDWLECCSQCPKELHSAYDLQCLVNHLPIFI